MLSVSEENRSGVLDGLEAENVVTPFTPIRPNFRDVRETQWMQVVRSKPLDQ